ncbi:sulfate adenylyltransferase subunit CysD [Lacibacterium aquatile]|uniref:Sulfate adenylyltransferase subunit 2 n=1 Tax=Lacibacterium aquatile TaxID=1168082 RepID=A0ABW5DZ60_9PROT
MALSHLRRLEAESIRILREVAAEFERPVLLYSIGKDSSVLLHLARKAFYPAPLPFPLLHIDTTWKFREMIAFRDAAVTAAGVRLIVHTNADGLAQGLAPFGERAVLYTDVMKTQALRQALDAHGFTCAIGGARRDEDSARAKERVISLRSRSHGWDPRGQRPEPWGLFNCLLPPGGSARAFPLSDWTEGDVWDYIAEEGVEVVPLYFAALRPVVRREGRWILVDDSRLPLEPGEVPEMRSVRFRTLGCYPLTAAIESVASTVEDIRSELVLSPYSERQGRLIDRDGAGAMERKKREGYF